jgi:ribosomal protein L37AE/L43A
MKKEENIWPCSFCEKKFKGDHYLIKHIENKHETELHEEKKKVLFYFLNNKEPRTAHT